MLPLCSVIQNAVFVVHGGLMSSPCTLDEIRRINRKWDLPSGRCLEKGDTQLMEELLWSDPCKSKTKMGVHISKRGAGVKFGM